MMFSFLERLYMQISSCQNNSYNVGFNGYVDKPLMNKLDEAVTTELKSYINTSRGKKAKMKPATIRAFKQRRNNIARIIEQNLDKAHPKTVLTCAPNQAAAGDEFVCVLKNPMVHGKLNFSYRLNTLKQWERLAKDLNPQTLHLFEVKSLFKFCQKISDLKSAINPKDGDHQYLISRAIRTARRYAKQIDEKCPDIK